MYIFFTGLTRRRSAADLRATPSFHRLLSRPVVLGDPLGTPWGPRGLSDHGGAMIPLAPYNPKDTLSINEGVCPIRNGT